MLYFFVIRGDGSTSSNPLLADDLTVQTVPDDAAASESSTATASVPAAETPRVDGDDPTSTAGDVPAATSPAANPVETPQTAVIAGVAHPISSACTTAPTAGVAVTSFLVTDGRPGTIVERIVSQNDEDAFSGYATAGSALPTQGFDVFADTGFAMVALDGNGSFPISVNTSGVGVGECSTNGLVTVTNPSGPQTDYAYGIVDMCTTADPLTIVGYSSEGGRLQITDNGGGNARVEFQAFGVARTVEPEASFVETDGRILVGGLEVDGVDGIGAVDTITIDVATSARRTCDDTEIR